MDHKYCQIDLIIKSVKKRTWIISINIYFFFQKCGGIEVCLLGIYNLVSAAYVYTSTPAKWLSFCRRHFKIHLCVFIEISWKFVLEGPIDINSTSVQLLWHWASGGISPNILLTYIPILLTSNWRVERISMMVSKTLHWRISTISM